MATFSSKPSVIDRPASEVAEKFSDLTRMQAVLDRMPEDERAKVGDVKLTTDSIIIETAQVGQITLKVTERSEKRVVLEAIGSPVPLKLIVDLKPVSVSSTEIVTSMDVEIPAFLKPMIGGAMQKAVDQFAVLMQKLS